MIKRPILIFGSLPISAQPESRTPPATTPKRIAVAIGPEGGFSDRRSYLGRGKRFSRLQLGARILRAETAPAALLAHLQTRAVSATLPLKVLKASSALK